MGLDRLREVINRGLNRRIKNLEAEVESQTVHIELLIQCDDSSTEVISKMDEEIEILEEWNQHLKVVIAAQKQTIRNQGAGNEEKHNILCGIKEEIDDYFGDI